MQLKTIAIGIHLWWNKGLVFIPLRSKTTVPRLLIEIRTVKWERMEYNRIYLAGIIITWQVCKDFVARYFPLGNIAVMAIEVRCRWSNSALGYSENCPRACAVWQESRPFPRHVLVRFPSFDPLSIPERVLWAHGRLRGLVLLAVFLVLRERMEMRQIMNEMWL